MEERDGRYLQKVILTVIALSLSTIAFKCMFVTTANAELEPYNLT
tara:strand:+ start:477 stop:611 length:135 start_codon:yes stop_codon:yes gene_type:complete